MIQLNVKRAPRRLQGRHRGGAKATPLRSLCETLALAALWVVRQKVTQCAEELVGVLAVAPAQSSADVVDDHLVNPLRSAPLLEQVLGESGSRNLRYMFVLRECENLGLVQSAERDTIFQGDHGVHRVFSPPGHEILSPGRATALI
jgi:hypothetical protein